MYISKGSELAYGMALALVLFSIVFLAGAYVRLRQVRDILNDRGVLWDAKELHAAFQVPTSLEYMGWSIVHQVGIVYTVLYGFWDMKPSWMPVIGGVVFAVAGLYFGGWCQRKIDEGPARRGGYNVHQSRTVYHTRLSWTVGQTTVSREPIDAVFFTWWDDELAARTERFTPEQLSEEIGRLEKAEQHVPDAFREALDYVRK